MSDKTSAGISFSARDMENLALAWQCFETDPSINYKKFAALAGYTEGSAKVTMGNLKRKLKLLAGSDAGKSNPTPKKTPGTGGSKKRAPTDGGEGPGTPTKKPRTPKSKSTGGKKANGAKGMGMGMGLDMGMGIEDDEDFSEMKLKSENADDFGFDVGAGGYDDLRLQTSFDGI